MKTRPLIAAVVLSAAAVLPGCGGDDGGATATDPVLSGDVAAAKATISDYCAAAAADESSGKPRQETVMKRSDALIAVDKLLGIARNDPEGAAGDGVSMRQVLEDEATTLADCDPQLGQMVQSSLDTLP